MYNENQVLYDVSQDRFYAIDVEQPETKSSNLLTVCYHIGYSCNLQCSYCSSKADNNLCRESSDISSEALCEFVSKYKIPRVVISGGEPLLYAERIKQTLRLLKLCGVYTFVSTNGTQFHMLSDQLLQYIDWFDVSLPATSRELYEKIRGADHFLDVIKFICEMKKAGKRIRISYTVSSVNFQDVYNLPLFSKELGIENVRISHTYGIPEGIIWGPQDSAKLKAKFKLENPNAVIYTPLSAKKVKAYEKGYIIINPSGDVFHFNTQEENKLFSLQNAYTIENKLKISEISLLQKRLFT